MNESITLQSLSLLELIANDPLVYLEVAALLTTLLCTAVYLWRLSQVPLARHQYSSAGNHITVLGANGRHLRSSSSDSGLCSLFEVGGLLSLPKRSLRGQRR